MASAAKRVVAMSASGRTLEPACIPLRLVYNRLVKELTGAGQAGPSSPCANDVIRDFT